LEGRAGWKAMFPSEKRELSAGCTEDKTEGRAGGLHKKAVRRAAKKCGAGCRKGQPSGPPFSAAQFNVHPAGPP